MSDLILNGKFLEIKKDPKMGRGVFATKNIKKGTLIEVSEIIIFNKKDHSLIQSSGMLLNHYPGKRSALALGLGSLFNHSDTPNVRYFFSSEKIAFIVNQKIKAGEQLFIDYGYDPTKM